MKRKKLGKTGLEVSIVGLGCSNLGLPRALVPKQHVIDPSGHYMNLEEGVSTVITAAETRCILFDTAPKYGNTKSETIIGEALQRRPDLFRDCLVTTKIGCKYPGDGFDHSFGKARASLTGSLQRLGMSSFDVVYLHDPMGYERAKVLSGTLRAMKELQKDGLIRHIGLAANDPETTADYLETGEFEVATVSGAWSLINQRAGQRIIPLARKLGVGLIVTTGLERGILATGPMPGESYLEREFSPKCLAHIEKIDALCKEWKVPLGAVALQWCTRTPEVASVIPGACNPAEAFLNGFWGSLPIADEFWSELQPLIRHFDITT